MQFLDTIASLGIKHIHKTCSPQVCVCHVCMHSFMFVKACRCSCKQIILTNVVLQADTSDRSGEGLAAGNGHGADQAIRSSKYEGNQASTMEAAAAKYMQTLEPPPVNSIKVFACSFTNQTCWYYITFTTVACA